jgi:hypothetical protein
MVDNTRENNTRAVFDLQPAAAFMAAASVLPRFENAAVI